MNEEMNYAIKRVKELEETIKRMLNVMEWWGTQEDGIPDFEFPDGSNVWTEYEKAKGIIEHRPQEWVCTKPCHFFGREE